MKKSITLFAMLVLMSALGWSQPAPRKTQPQLKATPKAHHVHNRHKAHKVGKHKRAKHPRHA
jgi:hypothetical protein